MTRTPLDRYELRDPLGRGGMGTVWRAYDPRLGREVAIKEVHLPEHLSPEAREEARARTAREAQAAARIDHPSVVTVHDVLELEGTPYIVMSLLDGVSLQKRLNTDGPLSEEQARLLAGQLLQALRAAHRADVVHRDIKPANIVLADRGERAVLTDFGIAGILNSGPASVHATGSVLGTAEYTAPERLERDEEDPASDLWSLGVTLYTALTGRSPFRRDGLVSTLSAVMTAPVPGPPAPGSLGRLVSGLLVRVPERRLTVERALALLKTVPEARSSPLPRPDHRRCRAPLPRQGETSTGQAPRRSSSPSS
ncbi:serine/threonine-protein kinase [Nocardiopsis ganjiahuensis]|uniref:serine/threonine-protein kinase n=1 Tax=Nocardiopsis ganjiahuensis TaxID=239984 RepID=UPI000347AE85|nr:serine/threonine-protein kinase [Nocardiopsis ganjiahuensis]